MNKNREHNYEAQNVYKIEGAATPAQEQATVDLEDPHFRESVAVLYDSSNWIVQFLKPSGRKLNRSFRAMKSKSLLRIFLCNQERMFVKMVQLLQSVRPPAEPPPLHFATCLSRPMPSHSICDQPLIVPSRGLIRVDCDVKLGKIINTF